MATDCAKEKWDAFSSEQVKQEDEEEEALSPCNPPVILIKEEEQTRKADAQVIETQQEFDFCSWGGPESKMCAADEVFFGGQILPLRLSVSSDGGLLTTGFQDKRLNLSRCESMDHGSFSGSRSNSSRSSSIRSQYSSTSTSTSTNFATRISKPRVGNQFHTYPSPQPQIRVPNIRKVNAGNHSRKSSSAWDFFRIGVVPTPEIGLQDLRIRSSSNRNSVSLNSCSSSSNSGRFKANNTTNKHSLKQFLGKSSTGFLKGCKCSIETVPSNVVPIKSNAKSININSEIETHAMKGKVLEPRKQREKQGKQAMSHRRTFEWLKELSHASYPNEPSFKS